MRRSILALAAAILFASTTSPWAQTSTWRPAILADHGMVASGHALASEAGIRVLRAGGNAVDAALAAWAVQGLVEPEMTGIGGDMFILLYLARTGEVKFINGTGPAPLAATVDFYEARGGLPADGPLSVSVPGAVGALDLAARTYGTRPLSEILGPAIELAERGFPITEALGNALDANREKLSPSARRIWFDGGRPRAMGERVVQRDLAATLRAIAATGAAAFYQGAIAQQVAAYMQATGGLIETRDLAAFTAHEDAPISITYKGIEVYECPPNSQGHVMLQALNILEGLDVRYLRHNSAAYLHVVAEALKLAFADRNRWVGDPRRVPPIPMRELLSKEYAAVRRALIHPDRASVGELPAGDPRHLAPTAPQPRLVFASPQPPPDAARAEPAEDGHTTYLAVVDQDRNMVSITSSLLSAFGSGHVVEGAGFFLNNRMAYFNLERDDVNVLEPGKRVRHTINPALALKDGRPYMVFGTPGADTQPQAQLQFFLNVVEFGMTVQQALEAGSIVTTGFRSSYYPHRVGNTLQVPASLPAHVREELAAMGHTLEVRAVRGVGSVKAILVHPRTGVLMGGVSPTRDSYVMAY